jgi:hypothetical protein
MQVSLSEFLKKVSELKTKEEKIEALRANDSIPLRVILQGAFDPSVVWLLPVGNPPYKPSILTDQEHVLVARCTKLRYFIKGFYDNLKQSKREKMFVDMLETVDKRDAELLCAIKDKKLPYDGITVALVREAIPDLIVGMADVEEDEPELEPTPTICPYHESEPEPELEPAPRPKLYRKSGKH